MYHNVFYLTVIPIFQTTLRKANWFKLVGGLVNQE